VDAEHGEECDPPNLEGTGCTEECKLVVCPALAFEAEGGTVTATNNGTYPSTATYMCDTGDPPTDGDAGRQCQLNGTWGGTAPTLCCPPERMMPDGSCLPDGTLVWDSGSVHNCKSKTFTLYLMPAGSWQDTDAEATRYQHLCEAYGLRPVKSGYTSYCNQDFNNCMMVSTSGSGASGSSSDVDDWYHGNSNGPQWSNFFFMQWSQGEGMYGWSNGQDTCDNSCFNGKQLSPVCGIEH
jgi:hypothetical protein